MICYQQPMRALCRQAGRSGSPCCQLQCKTSMTAASGPTCGCARAGWRHGPARQAGGSGSLYQNALAVSEQGPRPLPCSRQACQVPGRSLSLQVYALSRPVACSQCAPWLQAGTTCTAERFSEACQALEIANNVTMRPGRLRAESRASPLQQKMPVRSNVGLAPAACAPHSRKLVAGETNSDLPHMLEGSPHGSDSSRQCKAYRPCSSSSSLLGGGG